MGEKSKEEIAREAAEKAAAQKERREYVSKIMDPRTYGIEAGRLTDPGKARDALIGLRSGGCHILGPETHIDDIPPGYAIALRFAFVDKESPAMRGDPGKKSNGLWYEQKGGGLSLSYVSLNQLAHTAALSFPAFQRTDDGTNPRLARFWGRYRYRLFDGEYIDEPFTGQADLSEGSDEVAGKSATQVLGMRAKVSQRGESIAKAGAIRKALCIRGVYSWEEADMPFVFPALRYIPPTDDPVINRMVAARELGILGDIYGPSPARQIIDMAPARAALPDHGAPVDFAAEQARLDQRERVPVGASHAPVQDEAMPWDEPDDGPPEDEPPAPKGWEGTGYPVGIIEAWANAKGGKWTWREPVSPERKAWIVAYLTSDAGRADISGFVGVGPR